jgi:hypothetical protein
MKREATPKTVSRSRMKASLLFSMTNKKPSEADLTTKTVKGDLTTKSHKGDLTTKSHEGDLTTKSHESDTRMQREVSLANETVEGRVTLFVLIAKGHTNVANETKN